MSEPLSPTLASVARSAVLAALAEVHVAIPARVVRVDLTKSQIDAKPLVKDRVTIDGVDTVFSVAVIANVPVIWPGAGGMRVTFPIVVGDTVLLVFSERSLDIWLTQGGEVDPVDPRRHAISDAVAIPGLRSFNAPYTADGSTMTIGVEGGPFQPAALGQDVRTELDDIRTKFAAHTHAVTTTGGPTTQTGVSLPTTSVLNAPETVKSATVQVSE